MLYVENDKENRRRKKKNICTPGEILVNVTAQKHRSANRLGYNQKSWECLSPPHLAISSLRPQYNSDGLQLIELQDTDSLSGGVVREAQSQEGTFFKKYMRGY